jgi:hypothetical protein
LVVLVRLKLESSKLLGAEEPDTIWEVVEVVLRIRTGWRMVEAERAS